MTAPVALFVYNRLELTKQCVKSLQANPLAKQSALYIFSDGAKPGQEFAVAQVREYIKTVEGFASVSIYQASSNMGCASAVTAGMTQMFEQHEAVIAVEDDLIVATNFLDYMNQSLEFYKDKWAVSGWGMDLKFNNAADVYYSPRGNSWGWATWRKRWENVDWEVKDYPLSRKQRQAFNEAGADLARMLDLQMKGKINSWSIRFDYAQHKSGLLVVWPKVSKVLNMGIAGTHQRGNPGYPVRLDVSGKTEFNLYGMRDLKIDKQFRRYFGMLHKIKNRLRSYILPWYWDEP